MDDEKRRWVFDLETNNGPAMRTWIDGLNTLLLFHAHKRADVTLRGDAEKVEPGDRVLVLANRGMLVAGDCVRLADDRRSLWVESNDGDDFPVAADNQVAIAMR